MTEQPTTANHDEGELATVSYLPGATAVLEQPHPGAGPDPHESAPALDGTTETTTTVDLTKTSEPEVLEGKVLPAEGWPLADDPEGDKPWINPLLKTKEGRKARRIYLQRLARRKARRWVGRQTTTRGVVPATFRGTKRVHTWTRGVESLTADAAKDRARMTAKDASRAARTAQFAVMNRDAKKKASEKAAQEASVALVQAEAAASKAKTKFAQRATAAYLPLLGVDVTGIVMEGVPGLAAGLVINAVVFARVGKTPDLAPEDLEALERAEAGLPDRFELGMTARAFETMLQEALTEDVGVKLYAMKVKPHPWGFEVQVVLNRETPEKLSASLDKLEACLPGVRTNSILLQQSAAARNECTLRIPGEDPWRAVPELPYRKPNSVTTNDMHKAQIGADMGGRSLALPLKRTNACVVGKSRSGKSTVLRAILDGLTSTNDRIIIGIDLGSYGSGFGPYRKAMDAVACTTADARRVLEWALAVGMKRPSLFDRFGMGLNWESSRERPGITVVIDEFPALVTAAKQEYIPEPDEELMEEKPLRLDALVQQLALTSAKSDVTLVVATQAVTKDRIGSNAWLSELPVQVMCACDTDDIKLIAGGGAMAQGWRPDRLLPAMGNAINDASVCYVLAGADYCEPIPYRACITDDDEALRRAEERVKAGRPVLDDASARFVGIRNVGDLIRDDIFAAEDEDQEEEPAAPGLVLMKQIRELYRDAEVTGMTAPMLFEALAKADPDTWSRERLVVPGEDGEEDTTITEDELLAHVFKAVLEPHGLSWAKDKIRVKGIPKPVRGYALRDLKKLLGETDETAAEG
ncbi:hypothetical protein ACT1U9_33030 (plasmid) [Streptomyces sp. BR1]|uniref:hypothetical protein n=1 Tax=Streptomyces sp. BR1 TaxID=1592323 RepID=UPI00402B810D